MKSAIMAIAVLALVVSAAPAGAQLARTDAIWARTVPPGSITLDGNLNEPVWAQAESWRIHYHYDVSTPVTGTQGLPGSGWKDEGGFPPGTNGVTTNDSTNALLKFLVMGNKLYMGVTVPDKSIGGSGTFNREDGFLMDLKDHTASLGSPKPVAEYLYSWWYPREGGTVCPCAQSIDSAVGNPPTFKGRWAPDPLCDCTTGALLSRTAAQISAWDARTVVNGTTNSDVTTDVGYTVEMVFDLGAMGYDVTKAGGDTLEWNISIYDNDNFWKNPLQQDWSNNRTWWTCPWGNVAEQDEVRIYARPSVTNTSGPVPAIDPDLRMPTTGLPAPTIDGNLNDAVWAVAPSIRLHYADNVVRAGYPSVGKYRSGDFQARLSVDDPDPNPLPFVVDPGDATVKYFWKGDFLYLGFDVNDQRVQSNSKEDEWDGFTVGLTSRSEEDLVDHNLAGKGLSFHVGPTGQAVPMKDLTTFVNAGTAQVAMQLKAGTTVDSTGTTPNDVGYTAEMKLDLKALGYPAGLGDHTLFFGVDLHDCDYYSNPVTDSYGTRTWFFREREEECCPAWTLLDGTLIAGPTTGVDDSPVVTGFAALGNSPNPFKLMTTLEFTLAKASRVQVQVFDLSGRVVHEQDLGRFAAGHQTAAMQLPSAKAGVYLYRLTAHDPATGAKLASFSGKMMHLQ
jgi:hypothetical protein